MLHVSTRGEAPAIAFSDAMLAGLARDGGLYVPERWPHLPAETIAGFAGLPYADVAETVIGALAGDDLERATLHRAIADAYAAFRHPATCPLVQIDDNLFVLELFHGPTLAFKDVAMRLLAKLMDAELARRGRRATIVGATSGDTGSAAIDAFAGMERVDVFILFPHGRVSEVQRRQMTTPDAGNVHAIAIEGDFDDCQALVKAMFNHHAFRDRYALSGVNSINWARIMAQTVYYVTAAVALGAPGRPVSFCVPTGNFGNVFAGWAAKRMGLPIGRLVVATNVNDILVRALSGEGYAVAGVNATQSPSMDIQVSSNFERLLFEANGRDPAGTRAAMAALTATGRLPISGDTLARMRADFDAGRCDEAATTAEMARIWREAGYLLDPHSAIGAHVARQALARDPATPVVALGTAHPAKFPDAVARATGLRPALPPHLAGLMERPERCALLPVEQARIEAFVSARARIAGDASARDDAA